MSATGRHPERPGQTGHRQRIGEVVAEQANADVPRILSRLIERMHEKQPQDRYQSAEQVHQLLEQYVAHLNQPLAHEQPRLGLSRRSIRTRIGWTVAAALSCVVLGALGYGLANWISAPPAPPARLSIAECQQELQKLEAPIQVWISDLTQLESLIRKVETVPLSQIITESPSDPFQVELERMDQQLRQLEQQSEALPLKETKMQQSELPAASPPGGDSSPQANLLRQWLELRLTPVSSFRCKVLAVSLSDFLTRTAASRWHGTLQIHTVETFYHSGANQ